MIAQGKDGLSRDITYIGALYKDNLLEHVPLHLSARVRNAKPLEEWISSWFGRMTEVPWLCPRDWFDRGHVEKQCIWTPPLATARAALDQLATAVHKQPKHMHLVLIPRLMTANRRKLLNKICGLVFYVPVGTDIWPSSQHEPLVLGLSLPFCRYKTWKLRGMTMLDRVDRLLHNLPLSDHQWGGVGGLWELLPSR
jgi:hypothetical protein